MKLLWIFNHPAPYKIDFFNELGKSIDLNVVFSRNTESDRDPMFYYQKAKNFKCEILHPIKLGPQNNYTGKVVKKLKKESFDVIVVNGWHTLTEMKTIRYLKRHKIPYIFAINGGIVKEHESKLKKKIKTKYIKDASLYLAPDENSASYLQYYGADKSKIRLYPYSTIFEEEVISKPLKAEEIKSLKQKLGFDDQEIYVTAGQFIPRKNDAALIEIWKDVPKNKRLLLIGSGEEEKKYKDIIKDNHLDNVTIIPYKAHNELLDYFKVAEATIFLTKEDIYGHVVNESLSQGCPVIGSKNANSSLNLIVDGKNGFLIDVADKEAIIKAICTPISQEMREQAIATSKQNTIEIMAKRHLNILEEYLAK